MLNSGTLIRLITSIVLDSIGIADMPLGQSMFCCNKHRATLLESWRDGGAQCSRSDKSVVTGTWGLPVVPKTGLPPLISIFKPVPTFYSNFCVKACAKYIPDSRDTCESIVAILWSWHADPSKQRVWSSSAPWCSVCDSSALLGVRLQGPFPTLFDVARFC